MVATNEWATEAHAGAYLAHGADYPPHRSEGEEVLVAELPERVSEVLDLGTGDGGLLATVRAARPGARGVGVDGSPAMLIQAAKRFAGDPAVELVDHDLDRPLPLERLGPGRFEAVVSAFAIHHCTHERKRQLFDEVFTLVAPGGVFANLEHVSSPTPALHRRFFEALGSDPANEDPSNRLLDVGTQLRWLRQAGFDDVDCYWKWRELALLIGRKPR